MSHRNCKIIVQMIQLSEAAVNEILRLRSKRKNSDLLLRLGVQFDGCLGISYSIGFDEQAQTIDQIYTIAGLQVVVDPTHWTYIDGLVVDYSEDLMGGGFRFHNPNAVQTCGCGNSFLVESK